MGVSLAATLSFGGLQPCIATDGLAALKLIDRLSFAAVLMEYDLPDMAGTALIGRIRETSTVPILVLSARSTERVRIEALDLGADRFLGKPFSPPELLALVRASIRRAAMMRGKGQSSPESDDQSVFRAGALALDRRSRTAALGARSVMMRPEEFALLWTVALNGGARVHPTRLDRLLDEQPTARDDNLTTLASRVNRKLRDLEGRVELVRAARGRGWRLVA
jgi:two-component system KDP operon response regulator KdpE